MKIRLDSTQLESVVNAKAATPGTAAGGSFTEVTSLDGDHAELSMDHARVAELAAQIQTLPEIRQEKVAPLSDAIQNGSYDASAEQTADAMLTDFLGQVA
jgi:flagellar biosynthesis anti-sigma factor FlgM